MRISLRNVGKSYGATPVVSSLDVEIAAGTFFTLLGASGSGKTTTLRMIAGLEEPDQGRIQVGDLVVSDAERGVFVPPERRGLGMVFQSYAVWPHLSVEDNCALGLRARRLPAAETRKRVATALDMVGMAAFAARMPHQLSGGQQQRVAIARALAQESAVILFDEPLSNLDARLREQMRRDIHALTRRLGTTVVYVTHDQVEAMALSDQVGMMHAGRLVQYAPPAEIYRRPATPEVATFLSLANLLPAEIADGRARVGSVWLPIGPPAAAEMHGEALLMIRPEQILFSTGPEAFAGSVCRRAMLGPIVEYEVEVPVLGANLRVQELSTSPLRQGEVGLIVPSAHLHVLPTTLGRSCFPQRSSNGTAGSFG